MRSLQLYIYIYRYIWQSYPGEIVHSFDKEEQDKHNDNLCAFGDKIIKFKEYNRWSDIVIKQYKGIDVQAYSYISAGVWIVLSNNAWLT